MPPFHLHTAAPSDYRGGTYYVTIPANEARGKLQVGTHRYDDVEQDKYFTASLTAPEGYTVLTVLGGPAYVTIKDTTGVYTHN